MRETSVPAELSAERGEPCKPLAGRDTTQPHPRYRRRCGAVKRRGGAVLLCRPRAAAAQAFGLPPKDRPRRAGAHAGDAPLPLRNLDGFSIHVPGSGELAQLENLQGCAAVATGALLAANGEGAGAGARQPRDRAVRRLPQQRGAAADGRARGLCRDPARLEAASQRALASALKRAACTHA